MSKKTELMKMIKINFNEVQILDPSGNHIQIKDFSAIASELLWKTATTIPLYEASLQLYKGISVNLNKEEIELIINIFKKNQCFYPFAQVPLIKYLENKIKELEV